MRNWLLLSAGVIVLDQLTKWLIERSFFYGESLPLTFFFNMVSARNTGAAFSFLADHAGWQRYFFVGIALVAVAVILYLMRKHRGQRLFNLSLSLILGGAIGNAIDRVRLGYVIDFLDFHYAGWHYPAFNVADIAITVGAGLLILDSFRKPKP